MWVHLIRGMLTAEVGEEVAEFFLRVLQFHEVVKGVFEVTIIPASGVQAFQEVLVG